MHYFSSPTLRPYTSSEHDVILVKSYHFLSTIYSITIRSPYQRQQTHKSAAKNSFLLKIITFLFYLLKNSIIFAIAITINHKHSKYCLYEQNYAWSS